MQVFAFNLRRPKFQDARVRKAFNLIYNFEEANKKLFYESYSRPRGKPVALSSELSKKLPVRV